MTVRYPWPTLSQELTLTVDGVRVDGIPLAREFIDSEHLRIRLDEAADWQEVNLTVSVDMTVLSEVDGARAHAIVECVSTNVRIPFSFDPETGSCEIVLGRDGISDRFSVEVEATAPIRGRWRSIGTGPDWTTVLDPATAPVRAGMPPFETVWIDFRDPSAPIAARSMPDATAFMDLQGDPRLLLNTAVDGFQHLLHADTAKLERRRLRDLLGTDVARYALSCLFRAAVAEIISEDGVVQPPERRVYRQVCDAVAEQMPGIGSVDELYERVVESRESTALAQDLWGAADLVITSLSGRDSALATACQEVKYA